MIIAGTTPLILCIAVLSSAGLCSDAPCYYHQTEAYTYQDDFRPKTCSNQKCTVAPFVSPDNSVDAHLSLIKEAKSSIIIANPVFDSWNDCTHQKCNAGICTGCTLEQTQQETDPIFLALLEAIQSRKVEVKILTNDYSVPTCKNSTSLLDWLSINGAQIRFYKTTLFLHAKFMMIDKGAKVLISSVNFSSTSFKKNRETGVIVSDCDCDAMDLYASVYNYDWDHGNEYTPTLTYTEAQRAIITTPLDSTTSYKTPSSYSNVQIMSSYVSPDYARDTFLQYLNKTTQSLVLHIYDITDELICEVVVDLHKQKGVDVDVLVDRTTANPFTYGKRRECFKKMTNAGITVTNTSNCFRHSHQKYWIIDNTDVHLSTGNWNPSDFLRGYDNKPINPTKSPKYVSRNMLIVMRSPDIVQYFSELFTHDKKLKDCT